MTSMSINSGFQCWSMQIISDRMEWACIGLLHDPQCRSILVINVDLCWSSALINWLIDYQNDSMCGACNGLKLWPSMLVNADHQCWSMLIFNFDQCWLSELNFNVYSTKLINADHQCQSMFIIDVDQWWPSMLNFKDRYHCCSILVINAGQCWLSLSFYHCWFSMPVNNNNLEHVQCQSTSMSINTDNQCWSMLIINAYDYCLWLLLIIDVDRCWSSKLVGGGPQCWSILIFNAEHYQGSVKFPFHTNVPYM